MEGMYNKSIVNEIYPEATMFEAMRVWSLPQGKEFKLEECCDSGEYFGQIKKDGYWYQFNRTENHSYLFSRTESRGTGLLTEKSQNVPHIVDALSVLPKDTIIIGEIYIHGGISSDVTRIMGCLPKTAVERQEESGYVNYYIHDIIAFNGISLLNVPAIKRYEILKKVYNKFELDKHSFIELAISYTDNLFERIGDALDSGEEGMVLKKKTAPYTPGKKPAWSGIKCKKVDYADVVCMGFEDATKDYSGTELDSWEYWQDSQGNKYNSYEAARSQEYSILPITKPYYYDWKTSIRIGAYDDNGELKEIGTVSSGLTDDMKIKISNNPEEYIGQVVKIQCMQKNNEDQTIRHPIFKGFRDDKNAKECTLKDIF